MKKQILFIFLCLVMLVGCGQDYNERLVSPVLKKDMDTGIGIILDYESEEKIIFHGYFGLFVYDLKKEKVTLAIDLKKTLGVNDIQGEHFVRVSVNEEGSKIMLFANGLDTERAYYIHIKDGTFTYDEQKPFEKKYTNNNEENRFMNNSNTLNELTYTNGKETWKLFENWTFK